MLWVPLIVGATLFVAYANGANDNFKGVATLFGSKTTDYGKALGWATVTTFCGSLAACFVAAKLIKTFGGAGLVPDEVIQHPAFLSSVILGAGLTVFVAAKTGIPISTTHSLTGALVGSGCVAVGASSLGYGTLGKSFIIPLLASPLIAIGLTAFSYPLFRFGGKVLGVRKTTCVCVGEKIIPLGDCHVGPTGLLAMTSLKGLRRMRLSLRGSEATEAISEVTLPGVFIGNEESCKAKAVEIYEGKMFGISAQSVLDFLHFLSAGAVSFARGLNDTPKIVALAVVAGALGLQWNIVLIALAMALGGILSARRVAETVSCRITAMNHGEGLTANLMTSFLVIVASRWGVPVSTTHVSCGSLFGIGLANGKAKWNVIGGIVSAWVLTLPVAAILSGGIYWMFQQV